MASEAPEHWPSRLVKPDCGHCTLDGDLLSCSLGAAPVPNSREDAAHACVFKANNPVPGDVLAFYFELTVLERGDLGDITIGFIPPHAKTGIQPGLMAGSVGLNGSDGQVFKGTGSGESLAQEFRPGDVLGAGIIPGKGCVFFTLSGIPEQISFWDSSTDDPYAKLKKNGKMLCSNVGDTFSGDLIPAVSLRGRNPAISVNFGQQEYLFKLEELQNDLRAEVRSEVRKERIHRSHLHTVVRDYLVAHAYEDTLTYFDKAYSQRALPCLSRPQQSGPTHSAGIRKQIHAAILGRNAELAMQMAELHFPAILSTIRNVEEALAFAQLRLRPFKHCRPSHHHQQLLRDTLALLAYPDPTQAPMSYLVSEEHRQKAARVVNAAILFHLVDPPLETGLAKRQEDTSGAAAGDEVYLWRPWPVSVIGAPSFLERMMQQLRVVQGSLGYSSGMPDDVKITLENVADIIADEA